MFFYIAHEIIIVYVLQRFWKELDLTSFVALYLVFAATLIAVGYGLRALKRRWRPRPYLINFLIGG